jgi:hypothetical protein
VSRTRWERAGAICGLVFIALIVATFFLPATPDLDTPVQEAIADIAADEDGLLLSFYLGGLAAIPLIGFLGAMWSISRRPEGATMLSGALAVAGGAFVALILAGNGGWVTLTMAVDEGVSPQAVEALLVIDNTLFFGAVFAWAALFAVLAIMGIARSGLSPVLGWAAALVVALILVGMLGVFSEDDDGGVLGGIVFVGFLLSLLWILVTSVLVLMGREAGRPVPAVAEQAA